MSEAPENGAAGIAIVGMAGRFPGAADIEKFWDNLKAGVESVTFFSREELESAGVEPRLLDDPDYVAARAVLDSPDRFDAALFGFSPREAEVLDPQHRLLLECAWEALECAGYDPRRYDGLIGVYAGAGPNAYLLFNLMHNRDVLGAVGQFQAMLGNGGDFLATRLSYKLGLRGPSLTVQTACSTSLVAVHLAAQSLLNGECDMALAGGVRVSVPQRAGYLFQPDGILSPDGHCRPFDEEARGAIDGDGAGLVVLKRLDDALADGDRIHAVILGTAINNDGSGKVGYTAPGVDGQAGAVAMAQALAAVHPETVGLIEGHGTGTPLGDPVEVAALRQVFEATTARRRFCALGSVKSNVGHLDAAAGVASLIKAALALEREVIPPTLHFRRPNPRLGLDDSPFFVNAGPLPWPSGPEPRRAGVSSFGMGGTNAHVVLEEAPPVPPGDPSSHPAQLLVLSAASAPALEEMTDRLADWLERHPDLDLADVAFTLQAGRQVLTHRRALVCRDVAEAREALRSRRGLSRVQEPESRPVAFLGDGGSETARRWREWGIVPDRVLGEEGLDLAAVLERPGAVLVDLGTGALAESARRHPMHGSRHVVISSRDMLGALAELWLAGVEVDWRGFHAGERRLRVALPAYPFERRRYWIEGAQPVAEPLSTHPSPGSPHPLAPSPATPSPLPGRGGNRAAAPRPPLSTPFVEPRTDLERRLASFFQELLGIDPVGAFDSFFEIGGHSLLGLQLISRMRSELEAEVPLEALFQAATVADLAELVGLIEAENATVSGIPRVPRDRDLPLSFAQERLWFLDRLDPGTPAFNLNQAVRLTGALDVPALAAALAGVVRRHESLRTAFQDLQGRPVQRVLPTAEVPLPIVDLSGLPEELGEVEAGWLATRAGDRRFDLARPPLLAAELYRLAPDRHAVALVLHHIVGDGWSIAVLLTELAETYRALAAGEPSPLPPLEVQYPDFASWQRSRLGEAEIERQLAEWRVQLAPPLPILDLPTDRPRPAVQTFRGAGELLTLPPDLAESLRALGRAQGATPFMALLSAFSLVLSRWSGQEDLIIGSPIAGRDRRELEPLIGIFLNMLPLRVDLSGGPGFRAVLGRVREVALAAYGRQDVPVERLIEEVQPERDLSRSPLFQVLFNLQDFPRRAFDVPGLAIEALPVREVPSRFDLTVYGEETEGGAIALELVYNADLFDAATVRQLLAQLRQAVAMAVQEPDTPISGLSLVTPEAAAVLPDPRAPLPAVWTGAVHQRFANRARFHPERPAVIDASGTWTYGDLAERAGRLARRLRAEGVGRGDLVAVYAHRSAPLVQALLGVLEAGAAFLILDPGHPPPRLRESLVQASPRAFLEIEAAGLVPETLAEGIPASALRLRLRLGDVSDAPPGSAPEIGPDDLAYVAFTSGSTGRPKGILGSHGPLSHFCDWHSVRFPLGAGDRFSLLSGLSHDPLLRDVFTPLGLGATLCIPEPDDLGSPVRLAGWMARQRVTVSHLTPALGQILADGGTALPDLRHVFFGGDVLTEGDVARLRAKAPDAVCVNFYGATETPQAVAWFDASASGDWPARRVPVGRGIEGVQLLVLNEAGGLAAPGELGEVCVRTPYLALGYLKGERFGDTYRTGDLGRYRPDGAVVLAGRRDDQVQVRGFRVEPAEVEAALALHPAVRDAAVLLRGQVLTAWLATAGPLPGTPEIRELRDFLRQRLPDPMVPEAFVWLDRLPLTPNGKLDRRALPDPEPERQTGAEAPATPIEDQLATLWCELLGLDRVGRHDNFFALGGHSLLATRLVARVHETFGVDLPLRHLFEAPTIAGLARRIGGGEDRADAGPEEPAETAPVSFSQRRLWFLDRLEPGAAAYNLPFAVRLLGPLSPDNLARAFTGIARRHEPLRTTFAEEGGEPVQVIAPPAPVLVPLVDLAGLPPERRDPEALRLVTEDAARPFDLARGPLFHPLLLRLAPDAHVVSATMHHVVTDGWSTGILLRELGALYTGLPLPELRTRYADFAAWQRRWLEGPEPAGHVDYWKRRLEGAPVLELPTDRPRPAVRRGRGATEPVAFSPDLVLPLERLARGESATLYMALLAAFQVLLYRYTGQEDLVVGSPVAGRERPEVQDLIGFFVNALALRSRLRDDEPFRAFLVRVRDVCLEAYAHQELPFDKLVEEIQPQRSLARAPVFQVVLSLEERPREARLPDLEIRPLPVHTGASKFDLNLLLAAGDGRLEGFVEYDADLFEPDTIRRLIGHFGNLLAAAIADPGQRISELPLMGEAELRQLVVVPQPFETTLTLPDLFAAQAARRPDAVALSFEGEALTYGELARRAGHVARQLRGLGVGPEVPVALWCERDLGLPVAVLGVLAAGGVYVPVDPAWPAERVAFVLEDSGSRVLLRGRGTAKPPTPPSVQVIELNGGAGDGPFPAGAAAPDQAAYVIYTSGSTGRPKGVAVTHRNVARLLAATQPWFGFGEGDVWTLFHSYAFDFSVWEIWGALAHGGRLVVVPFWAGRSPEALAEILEREGVTVLNQTPSAFYALLDAERRAGRAAGPALSWVIFGGEALDAGRLAPWWERHGADRPRLANMYGITETTVHVTFRQVLPEDAWSGAGSAVGKAIPDLAVHVLGPGLVPVPLGVSGELHVGGAGLARGYLGRPDLTAERFVPDPFAQHPGARLYRTGDLGRRRASGELEYLGRVDRQVKVRGFRIEPGEIEAALVRHPAVAEAAVVVRDDLPGGRGLAAFWTSAGEFAGGTHELRAFLKEHLPEALVPVAFARLDRLPVTANGKVDRRALAALRVATTRTEPSFAAPRTPAEELLAGLWTELLGRERVAAGDDFFELGGHSLLATQLVSRVRETLGVELPLRAVFQAPTLSAMAAALSRSGGEDAAPPIVPVDREGGLPLSFAQQRLWFLDRLVPGNPFFVMAFGLRLEGRLDVGALRQALREVVRRQGSLRTTFHTVDGEPRQVVAETWDVPLPLVDLSGREDELRVLGQAEARRPFDLRRGPLLRGLLVRRGAEDHVLLLHLHHIIADGWSMGVLRRELSVLYDAFAGGRPSPLPELPVQYADFAVWQRRWLSGEPLERQLGYWRRQLAGVPPVLELPLDRPRPAVETFRGGVSGFALEPGLVERLRVLGRGLGCTLSMIALAAYDLVLSRYTRRDDVVVGSAVANRNRRETEELVGFFVNVLVLRTDLSGDPTFAGLAGRVREMSLDAYAHQDLPFEKLVEELRLPRDLAHHPLCQAMYGFQNFPRHELRVRGLAMTPLEGEALDTGTAKADITLFIAEVDDTLQGWIEFNGDLFEEATIRRMQRHLAGLLESAAADPGRPISVLPMLAEAERHQLLREWSEAPPAAEAPPFLAARFLERVREAPDAAALVWGEGTVSYGGLHRRAASLARRLRALGVAPEVRVGLRLERPAAMVEGILGVVLAGGAWLPLDPSYPPARLDLLLREGGCSLLLTDEELPPLPREGGEDLEAPDLLPGNLAYVIYTSGSTGTPKGVAVTQSGLARVTDSLIRGYGIGRGDHVLLTMSPSFDVYIAEVATTLGSGATVHVAGRDERMPGPPLAALLRERGITVLDLMPSMVAALEPEDATTVRTLVMGGEICPPELAERWAPGRRIRIAYGPTETTITCTVGAYEPGGHPPILGRPLAGARLHLLDAHLEPVPAGVPGELFVAGEGVSRGYLNRPDLTAERFLPDPFGPAGSRFYRTGDLVRRLADGYLEFLSRIDEQVKLRGFRVEPGEVEARLAEHPEVATVVVVVRGETPAGRGLVAYVVPKRGSLQGPDLAGREEHLESWQGLYEELYARERREVDLAFDISGWNSSFTGEPIPAGEMREWVEATVEEILALRPNRVLEIGCGTGLLLQRIAPRCSLYVGTDLSAAVLADLGRQVADLPQVRLEHRRAHDFDGIPERSFDTIILNSVVQYFPGGDYLVEVLEKAVATVADGGSIFLGDVRSLPLAEAFHLAVELHGADPSLPVETLRGRAATHRLQEAELLVAPALFHDLRRRLDRIGGVEIRPKRGRADNELTRFRYQVVLRVGEAVPAAEPETWLDWDREGLTLTGLARRLREERPDVLAVERIPNARVAPAVTALRLLASEEVATAGELREAVLRLAPSGVHPNDLRELAAGLGYEAHLIWEDQDGEGRFEAVLSRLPLSRGGWAGWRERGTEGVRAGAVGGYTNDPLLGRLARRLVPELRSWAQETLPDFLVPSAFVVLESLPRMPSGKIDRRALPAPELAGTVPGEEVAPRTPAEIEVAAVFRVLLGRERLGAETDFFAAGGHSLLATQAVSRLRERFGVELALRELFETPTVAGLARRIETALAERRALEAPPIRPASPEEIGGPPPLSFAQERLWFLDQLDAGRSPWSLFSGIRFLGRLDLPALAAALDELARRHESLRTTFAVVDGRPVQVIAPEPRTGLPLVDLSGLPGELREAETRRWIDREAQRPFDLAAGPLMRSLALRLGPEEHAIAIVLHHIVSDGWSMGVLNRDLGELYAAFMAGRPSPLAPLPVQYADFAVWQRSWLQGEALERQLGYWRERLAGAPPVLALPIDRPRPAVRAFHGRRRTGELAPETVAALSSLARRSGATLFMTLLAAWQALLFRVTGEPDLVVGTPVANRDRVELEGLIGFFVNTLAMRADLTGAPGFLALLDRVREAALGAYAHQDLPFEKLVEELAPERDLRHTPVFQAFFAFEEETAGPPDVPGLTLVPLGAENRSVKFDLTLLARRLGGAIELVVAYNSDLFHATTAERLLGHLRTLIESAVADPGRPVGELPLLSEAQRHQLLPGWNDTAREIEPLPLHRIFEAQAALRPDRAALVAAGESLTYGEVDRRAGRLARLLAREGVGPEVRVALCLGHSPWLVTSILAVLKAGGAWVPLDPDLPRERLAFLLEDSGAALLITEERLLANLPETGIPVLVLDLERDALEREDGPTPSPELSPDSLAYVIYTSGSTGTPKGVAVTHRGLASLARAQVEVFGLDAGDRILQFASPAFDASVSEMAIAWQAGAELHLAAPGDLLPGASLAVLLRERGITNVTLPPTALSVTPMEELPRLRSLVVAGEACPPELAERWSAGRRFTNAYGPTETTVCATAGPYEPGSLRMTLGRPIANARVHLLDPAGVEPVAIGVAGELCVAGPGLARGYLGRPDLTAERFVPDPWAAGPGARLYRTGDLARWLGDGRIELLGRIDEQVKVRGFRVEPGEVRAALLAHPAVREAEVMAPADVQSGRGERRLVAWIAAGSGAAELREYLESRLPGWLVPSRFVFLDTLPKTASGKVDRRALPLPDDGEGRAIEGRREPADELERFLLETWREVLGLRSIGVEEDFFALGGTSLQAAILTNLLQERLGDYVYAVALFDAPTIAELARYLDRHYPAAAARIRGEEPIAEEEAGERVDAGMVAEIRRLIGSRPRLRTGEKNPRAVFVLSPPRSGSTLLRVLLAGNGHLFAPPELELLGFDTLGERARELSGRFGLWREGVVRAVMEARGCGFEEADALLAAMEAEDLPVAELYRRLQAWTAGRTLVDKTPSYALDRNVLERAEELFDEPLYIHLLRHPYATVASFEEAKLEQVFFRPRHSFTRRQLAELIWQVSHRNILDFLETVPAERRLRVRFEDLVRRPRAEMERASAFLGVPFEEGMLDPYARSERKMTDGVHALSRMLGDVKFHTHSQVDPEVADRWKTVYRRDFLGDDTWKLARELGYEERAGAPRHDSLVKLRAGGTEPPLFLIHPLGGSAASYRELAARLDADRPVYGLQALGLGAGEEPQESFEEMASYYLEQVRRVAPEGPYHLGGWSLGGVIAFEMARQLVHAGERVDLLALFDAVVPGELPNERYDAVSVLRGLAWELGNLTGMDLKVSPEELRGLDGEEGVRYLLQRAHEAGALPPGFGVDQAVRTWRIIDANAVAFKKYKAQVYPGRAILFVAEKSRREGLGPDLGWNRVTTGGVERVLLDAHHSTVLRGAALETIVERLKAYLVEERVGAEPGG